MIHTEFDVNWQFLMRIRQNAAWQSFENELSRELEKAFCTPGLARIRSTSKVIGTDGNDVSFVIDLLQMEVRLFATGEVGIIRRDTATCMAPPGELWEYEESDGDWKSYDLASCELFRIARGSGRITTVVHSTDDRETHSFEIDLEYNHHINRSTNKWHNIRLNTESQLVPKFPEPAKESSQLDYGEVDVLTDNAELTSQGNVVDGMQVNIKKLMKQYVEMRHMDGKYSIMEDESYLDDSLLAQMPNLLKRLELNSDDIKRVQNTPIGRGGYSKVYRVKYSGEIMAAKVFKIESSMEEYAKDIYAMFSREVCLLSQLQNERIVKFQGFVATNVEFAIVLEYVQQGSLRSLLNRENEWKKLLPAQRHRILLDAAEGMLFLHKRNIAHRDLKSDNILITDDCRAKITDFGLSKSVEVLTSNVTRSIKGTFQFIAPEGFDASTKDNFKGDVYSFGIFLWEVMSGILGRKKSIPWAGMSIQQVMYAVHFMKKRPELLTECISDENVLHSTAVINVMNQCLSYVPTDRPSFDFVVASLDCIKVKVSDMDIMEKLYESTGGALWTRNKDKLRWQLNSCTSMFREADGRITYINLSSNNLIGMIPQELGKLSHITYLNLSRNIFKGAIPLELGKLSELKQLYLNNNQLTGEIPVELGELSKLEHLDLSDNKLAGEIPVELGKLLNLENLYLHGNKLTGAIPVEHGKLSKLVDLRLYGNKLTGKIPVEIGKLPELKELYLYSNQLTGKIPVEIGKLLKLEWLNLSGNQLTDAIPLELGKLLELQWFNLSGNQLTGTVPLELGKLLKLEWLNLSGNQLTGTIPLELGKLLELKELYLYSNKLTGEIPVELGELKNLVYLRLENNKLTGAVPKELGELKNLTQLLLQNNQLTGAVPKELGELKNLTQLSLQNNQLTGAIPKELGELSNLKELSLQNNQLTGAIPKELGELSELTMLSLRDNQLTGAVPKELGQLNNLVYLLLEDNQLTGVVPKELGELKSLTILYLNNNQLTGDPPIIPGCSNIWFHPQRS